MGRSASVKSTFTVCVFIACAFTACVRLKISVSKKAATQVVAFSLTRLNMQRLWCFITS